MEVSGEGRRQVCTWILEGCKHVYMQCTHTSHKACMGLVGHAWVMWGMYGSCRNRIGCMWILQDSHRSCATYIGELGMRTGIAMVLAGLKRAHMDLQKMWRGREFVHMYLNMYKASRGRLYCSNIGVCKSIRRHKAIYEKIDTRLSCPFTIYTTSRDPFPQVKMHGFSHQHILQDANVVGSIRSAHRRA